MEDGAATAAASSGVEVRRVVNPGALRKSDASLKVALSVLKRWGEASDQARACLERCQASQAGRKEFELRPRGVGLGAKYLSHGQRVQGTTALLGGGGGAGGGGTALPEMLEASKAKRERREKGEEAAAAAARRKRRGRGGDDEAEDDGEVRGDSRNGERRHRRRSGGGRDPAA